MSQVVVCPSCASRLDAAQWEPGYAKMCGRCHHIWDLRRRPPLGGKAIASLVLGLSSIVGTFFTGVPAIVLGLSAWREVRHDRERAATRRIAWIGIISGGVLGLLCAAVIVAAFAFGAWAASSVERVSSHQQVCDTVEQVSQLEIPAGFEGVEAVRLPMNIRTASFVWPGATEDAPDRGAIGFLFCPQWLTQDAETSRRQLQTLLNSSGNLSPQAPSTTWTVATAAGELPVRERVGEDPQGRLIRRYEFVVESDEGQLGVVLGLRTGATEEEDRALVAGLFRSIRLRP